MLIESVMERNFFFFFCFDGDESYDGEMINPGKSLLDATVYVESPAALLTTDVKPVPLQNSIGLNHCH